MKHEKSLNRLNLMFERVTHKKTMGCGYLYQVNAIPQMDGTGSPEKTKKPGHRPKKGRNGVLKETKRQKTVDRKLCFF